MMKRVFGDEDRKKKQIRISNKGSMSSSTDGSSYAGLENAIRTSLKDGYLPCPTAFKIAKDLSLPIHGVGEATDKLNIRIVDCQLGCFKVEKTPKAPTSGATDPVILEKIEASLATGTFTCSTAFEIARRMKVPPIHVANAANSIKIKIHDCQLGCF